MHGFGFGLAGEPGENGLLNQSSCATIFLLLPQFAEWAYISFLCCHQFGTPTTRVAQTEQTAKIAGDFFAFALAIIDRRLLLLVPILHLGTKEFIDELTGQLGRILLCHCWFLLV
jgi:hypothetical protein